MSDADVDAVRRELFKAEGAFVDKLRTADKSDPALHDEAVVRLNALFKYASVQGRGQFLAEMKIPGAWREARRVYEVCLKGGGTEDECQEAQAKVRTFRPIFDALERLSGKRYGSTLPAAGTPPASEQEHIDVAFRVIADHRSRERHNLIG